jgi:hypothetical protein
MKLTVCASVVALAASSASAQLLFFDDFSDGPAPEWGNEFGNWVAPAGEYYANNPGNIPATYTLLPYVVGDMDLIFDVREVQDGGVWLHCDATRDNGVLLVMGGDSNTYPGFYWHVITGGAYSIPLGRSGPVLTLGSNYSMRVRVRGDTFEVFLDGNPAAATTLVTNVFPTGRAGFYDNTSGQMRFDNVLLSVPCGADYNDDLEVDILDFLDFFDDFGQCEQQPGPCGNAGNADVNGDTLVDILDFLDFFEAFGSGCG